MSFESQLISGPFVSESKSGSSSSSTSSELSDYFHHAQEYRNPNLVYKKSLHKSSRRTDPVKQEKYIFNFEESAQSSNKFSAPVPGLPESPEKKPLTLTTTPDALFPSIEALMDPIKHGVDMGTLFSSLEEASAAAIKTSNVPPDPTLPCTLQQKKAIVKALFNAINSIDHAEDNPGMIRPFAEKKYEPVRIENACWQILVRLPSEHHVFRCYADYCSVPGGLHVSSDNWSFVKALQRQGQADWRNDEFRGQTRHNFRMPYSKFDYVRNIPCKILI